jgi:prophage tail gpP-like protein
MRTRLICDGKTWEGWKSFSVKHDMESAVHSLTIDTTDREIRGVGAWNVKGGSEIQFYIDEYLIFDGYAHKYDVNISSSNHSIGIEGSSKAIDIVECSHLGPYFWKNTDAKSIVSDVLEPFEIKFQIEGDLGKIGKEGFRAGVNETPFEIIRKLAEKARMTVYTTSKSELLITDGKKTTDGGRLARGDWTQISSSHDMSASFSKIIVKSQQNDRDEATEANFTKKQQSEKSFTNKSETRHRPLVYVGNGESDTQAELAEYVRQRFLGDKISAELTVKSHLNKAGKLWEINQKLSVDEPLLDLSGSALIIAALEFKLDDGGGFETVISLKPPKVFNQDEVSKIETRQAEGAFEEGMRDFFDSDDFLEAQKDEQS